MTQLFDYEALIRQRNRSAHRYFGQTELPMRVEDELLDRLSVVTLEPDAILVLGAISSAAIEHLCARYPGAHVTVTDCAGELLGMLQENLPSALKSRLDFDVRSPLNLELGAGPFDLVFSNLYLPLCDDLNDLFVVLHRLMKADGCLHFSCLGPDSLRELNAAWTRVDPDDPYHTLVPPDMHDVGDALVHSGFREPVMDRENLTLTYSTVAVLLEDLRNHGVCNGFTGRKRGLTGRSLWGRFLDQLEQQRREERLPLTVELVIGQAWRGDGMSQQRRSDGAVGISLEAFAHRLRSEQGDG